MELAVPLEGLILLFLADFCSADPRNIDSQQPSPSDSRHAGILRGWVTSRQTESCEIPLLEIDPFCHARTLLTPFTRRTLRDLS